MYIKKIILWILVLGCAGSIVFLSSQPASKSNQTSRSVTSGMIEIVPPIKRLPQEEKEPIIKQMNHWVRNAAHFLLFGLLGMLVLWLMFSYQISLHRGWIYTLLLCLLFAIVDEIHQLFVPGRGSQVIDVIIDFSGVLIGSYLAVCISKRRLILRRKQQG